MNVTLFLILPFFEQLDLEDVHAEGFLVRWVNLT